MLKSRIFILVAITILAFGASSCGSTESADLQNNGVSAELADADSDVNEGDTDNVAEKNNSEDSTGVENANESTLPDGIYSASFDTDGTMFHVNEVCDGKGVLTVDGGEMTIHLIMPSKNVVNLYLGLAEDAQKDGAPLIEPTVEEVTYDDGLTEEVNAFDVPVPILEEEFDLALVGTKGTWYDHKVKVSNPMPLGSETADYADGEYQTDVTLVGGSGKASVESPATVVVKDGTYTATIKWSSPHYDYMVVDGEKYEPINSEGNSVFEIAIDGLDRDIDVIADTTAMSEPHEIEYTLHFTVVN